LRPGGKVFEDSQAPRERSTHTRRLIKGIKG
jgi:hypothetical protein